jgi:hypothetical protein
MCINRPNRLDLRQTLIRNLFQDQEHEMLHQPTGCHNLIDHISTKSIHINCSQLIKFIGEVSSSFGRNGTPARPANLSEMINFSGPEERSSERME